MLIKRTQVNATYFIRSELDLASTKTYDLIYNSLNSDNFVRFGCNNKNYHFSLGGHFEYSMQINENWLMLRTFQGQNWIWHHQKHMI